MKHIPYGYLIVDGKAVVDEEKAKCVKTLFEEYTKGLGLIESAKEQGLKCIMEVLEECLEIRTILVMITIHRLLIR